MTLEIYYNWQRGTFLAHRAIAIIILAMFIWFVSGGEWVYQLVTLTTFWFMLQSSVITPYRYVRAGAYNDRNSFTYEQTARYEFGDGFMETHYGDGTGSHINLQRFDRVFEADDYFVLTMGSRAIYYLPFRAFRSPEDVARLESLMSRVLVSKATAQKRWGTVHVRE